MKNDLKIQDIATSTNILPKLMHYFSSSFKPDIDIPIKKNEVRTILELHFKPGQPMKHYIDSVDMESGSFTYLADKLERKEVITRCPADYDKRITVLQLTAKGENIANKLLDMFNSHITNLLKALNEQELEEMKTAIQSLEKIYDKLNSDKV